MIIRALKALGVARDVQLLPKNAERFRIRKGEPLPLPVLEVESEAAA
jgi:hypothetical protein